jgi:hypothetical protein
MKFPDAKFIAPGALYEFFFEDVFNRIATIVPKGSQQDFPLDLYIQSADAKPYIAHGFLTGKWEKDEMKIYSTTNSPKQEPWPANVK